MPRALLVESDTELLRTIREVVDEVGFEVIEAGGLKEARQSLHQTWPDIVVLDVDLPDGDGVELLGDLMVGLRPDVVLVVDEERADEALRALRDGAGDYLGKPINPRRLRTVLKHVARTRELIGELDEARGELKRLGRFGRFVGASPAMRPVYDRIARVAPSDATVLVVGESGTGKELVAQTLHEMSPRRHGPFRPVNCGAVAGDLIESELFGHEKGAFTGAQRRHQGWFERADGGTLFLDEITEMPADAQVKLLRVLESGQVTRVGGEAAFPVDVRVIAATNRNVDEAVEESLLREDLYYRLKVVQIWVPPLRDRGDDIELLAHFFLEELNRKNGTDLRFCAEALERIRRYRWPGNVRELNNAIHSAFILADDEVAVDLLPAEVSGAPAASSTAANAFRVAIGSSLAEVEKRLILATLEHCDANKTRAAEVLGIAVKTLYNKLEQYAEP